MRIQEFKGEAEHSERALFFFFANWSVPSLYAKRTLEGLIDGKREDELVIYMVEGDKHLGLMERYKVAIFPTLVVLERGQVLDILEGYRGEKDMRDFLDRAYKLLSPSE